MIYCIDGHTCGGVEQDLLLGLHWFTGHCISEPKSTVQQPFLLTFLLTSITATGYLIAPLNVAHALHTSYSNRGSCGGDRRLLKKEMGVHTSEQASELVIAPLQIFQAEATCQPVVVEDSMLAPLGRAMLPAHLIQTPEVWKGLQMPGADDHLAGFWRHMRGPGRLLPSARWLAEAEGTPLQPQPVPPAHMLIGQRRLRHLRQAHSSLAFPIYHF